MGIDLSAMWQQAQDAVSQGVDNALNTGGQAGLAYIEQQGVQIIQADQAQHVEAYQKATSQALDKPSSPNSFSSYLSSITQGPIMQKYGLWAIGGVAVIVGITLFLRGK